MAPVTRTRTAELPMIGKPEGQKFQRLELGGKEKKQT
jgi:hypothetical protein